jgi:hypothetical protein
MGTEDCDSTGFVELSELFITPGDTSLKGTTTILHDVDTFNPAMIS